MADDSKVVESGEAATRGTRRPPNAGKGRKKGSQNKATGDMRKCVALIAENLWPEVEGWIRRGARKQPLKAAQTLANLMEFNMPKLARTEITGGRDGAPITINVKFTGKPDAG